MRLIEKDVSHNLNFTISPVFSAGDYAINFSSSAPISVSGRHAPRTPQYKRLLLAACHALEVKQHDIVKGVLALPLDWANTDGPEIAERLSGKHSIEGIDFTLKLEHKSQGILAIINHAVDFDGSPLNIKLLDHCVVDDIGGGTTDIAEVRMGRVGNRKQSYEGMGVNQIAEKFRQEMKQRGIMVRTPRARQVLIEKEYLHRGIPVPGVAENIDRLVEDLAGANYNALQNQIPDESLEEVESILLTGGAGLVCHPYLQKYDSRFICGEFPLYDNALGALKGAMRNKGNYVYIGFDIGNSHLKAVRWMGDHVMAVCFRSVIGERIFEESAR